MAQLAVVLPVLSAIGGFLSSYGGLILSAASIAASFLIKPSRPSQPDVTNEGPRMGDTDVMFSTYGTPIPICYGEVRLGGNLIWALDIEERRVVHETDIAGSEGGKGSWFGGGGGDPATMTSITYEYFGHFAVGFAEGEAQAIPKIWADGKLIYGESQQKQRKYSGMSIRRYLGTETQGRDRLIASEEGNANTPAFRGMVYIVFEDMPLQDFGNRIPQINALIRYKGSDDFPISVLKEDVASTYLMAANTATGRAYVGRGLFTSWVEMYQINLENDTLEATATTADWLTAFPTATNLRPYSIVSTADNRLYILADEIRAGAPFFGARVFEVNPFNLQVIRPGVRESATRPAGGTQGAMAVPFVEPLQSGLGFYLFFVGISSPALVPKFVVWSLGEENFFEVGSRLISSAWDPVGVGGTVAQCQQAIYDPLHGEIWVVGWRTNATQNDARLWRVTVTLAPGLLGTTTFLDVDEYEFSADLGITEPTALAYDPSEDALIIFGGDISGSNPPLSTIRWVKVDRETLTELDALDPAPWVVSQMVGQSLQQGPTNGFLAVHDGMGGAGLPHNPYLKLFVSDMTTEEITTIQRSGIAANVTYYLWESNSTIVGNTAGLIDVTRQYHDRTFEDVGDATTLDEVLLDLSERAGLTISDVDFDVGVSNTVVKGYVIGRQAPIRQMMEPLSFAYNFDAVESDYQVKFVERGSQSSVDTFDEEDLAAQAKKQTRPTPPLVETRAMEVEIPEEVYVRHVEPSRDWQEGTQHAHRPRVYEPGDVEVQRSQSNETVPLPITMTAKEAKEVAEVQLYQAWSDRTQFVWAAGPRYLRLDPTDVATINLENVSFILRLYQIAVGDALTLEFRGTRHDAEIYTSDTAAEEVDVSSTVIVPPGPTELFLLDTPLLRDSDASGQAASGIYVAFGAYKDAWVGAHAHSSLDGSTWFTFEVARDAIPWGFTEVAIEALPPSEVSPTRPCEWNSRITTWDRVTEIIFYSVEGASDWASLPEDQVRDTGANAVYIKSAEGTEILQFATAVDGGDGTVTISDLLRGRRGTEVAAQAGHSSGARVLLLDPAWVMRKSLSLEEIGVLKWYRAISLGELVETAARTGLVLQGNDLKPYPVVDIERNLPPGGGARTLTLTWVRRVRMSGADDWNDGITDVPLGETIEEYDAVLLDPTGTTEELVKTVTSETVSFTDGEQTTAGYGSGDPLEVVIYQKSAIVGRGYPRACTV